MYDALKHTAALLALGLAAGAAAAHKPEAVRPMSQSPAHVEVQPRDGGFAIVSMSGIDFAFTAAAPVQLGTSVQIDRAILLGREAADGTLPRSIRR